MTISGCQGEEFGYVAMAMRFGPDLLVKILKISLGYSRLTVVYSYKNYISCV